MIKLAQNIPAILSKGYWERLQATVTALVEQGKIDPNKEYGLYITDKKAVRTTSQNNYYWGVVLTVFGDAIGEEAKAVHDIFKRMFAPYTMKLFPGGKKRRVVKSSSDMTVEEMSKYIERCIQFCAEQSIIIPSPEAIPDKQFVDLVSRGVLKR
jgi:hypothetical protein